MGVFISVIGLCIGSFLNVCIYRIPREESIVFPASHCTGCGYNLKWIDLMPIVSWLLLKGECRKCDEKISFKYPLVELINGLIYLLLFLKFGLTLNLIFYCILASLLIVISFIDLETKYIYTFTTILGMAITISYIVVAGYMGNLNILNNILGGAIGFIIIYIIVIITKSMGEGDAELAGVCGLLLGVNGIFIALFLSIIIAGMTASILLLAKLKDRKSEIAFGPYISIGAVLCLLYGEQALALYMKLFL